MDAERVGPKKGSIPQGSVWLVLALLGGLGLGALALRFGSTVRFTLALAGPSAEASRQQSSPESGPQETVIPANGRRLMADLYRPAGARGALLLVHGLSRAARRHPELVRLARLFAQHGRLVLVPEFEGLAAFRLTGREVDEMRAALRHLGGLSRNVGVAGFSFGAGPALLAAADHPNLRVVGSFGGYADLRHVILFVTTGLHTFGGRRFIQRQEEYNRWKLLALLSGFVEDERDRRLLQVIADQKLRNPSERADNLQAAVGDEGQRVLAVVVNRQQDAADRLLAGLSFRARDALGRLSPLWAVPRLSGRLLIAHGAGDDSIPFTESLRLAEASRGRARLVILESFHHTSAQSLWRSVSERAADGWRLLGLVDDLLT